MYNVRNYILERKPDFRYRKAEKLEIKKQGRWGPKWLHRLIFRAAYNLGMVRNMIDVEMDHKIHVVELTGSVQEKIENALFFYLRNIDMPITTEMEIICGYEEFTDLMLDVRSEARFQFDYSWSELDEKLKNPVVYTYKGITIRVIPYLKGIAVIPKNKG